MLHAVDRRRRGAHGRRHPAAIVGRRRQGVDQHRRGGAARFRPRGGGEIRQPVHRRGDRRQDGRRRQMGRLHPWRAPPPPPPSAPIGPPPPPPPRPPPPPP